MNNYHASVNIDMCIGKTQFDQIFDKSWINLYGPFTQLTNTNYSNLVAMTYRFNLSPR